MPLYSYNKVNKPRSKRIFARIVSLLFIIAGLSMLFIVLYPIVTFELYYAHKFANLTSAVVTDENKFSNSLTQVLGVSFNDLTRASLWFPQASPVKLEANSYNSYNLSIPKLKIDNASVIIGSEDLSKSLIQYTGSKPGSIGNPVIFGHSTLLLFYNPRDYKAIFSKLPDLSIGDEIGVTYDKVSYTYKVYQMYITHPRDLKVLDQNTSEEQITLVTCVPQGTYLKRFIVKARLERT